LEKKIGMHTNATRIQGGWRDKDETRMPDTYMREAQAVAMQFQEQVLMFLRGGGSSKRMPKLGKVMGVPVPSTPAPPAQAAPGTPTVPEEQPQPDYLPLTDVFRHWKECPFCRDRIEETPVWCPSWQEFGHVDVEGTGNCCVCGGRHDGWTDDNQKIEDKGRESRLTFCGYCRAEVPDTELGECQTHGIWAHTSHGTGLCCVCDAACAKGETEVEELEEEDPAFVPVECDLKAKGARLNEQAADGTSHLASSSSGRRAPEADVVDLMSNRSYSTIGVSPPRDDESEDDVSEGSLADELRLIEEVSAPVEFYEPGQSTVVNSITGCLHAAVEKEPADVYLGNAVFTSGSAYGPLCGVTMSEGEFSFGEPRPGGFSWRCKDCLSMLSA
jgi:hypothetical protein